MLNKQTFNEAACHAVPEQRPVGIAVGALHRQAARKIEQRLVVAGQALDQLCFKCRALGGCKRKPAWINCHYEVATFLLSSWQGAMMRMKVDRSPKPVEQFKR